MSKKKSKKSSGKNEQNLELLQTMAVRNSDFDDDDGFQVLRPTEAGKKKLEEVKMRRSKKSTGEKKDPIEPAPPRPYEDYNPSKVSKILTDVIAKIKDEKFGKAMEARDKGKIEELIDAFMNMEQDLPMAQKVNAEIRKLIQIGKSFYEYDDKHREFIDNVVYDGLIARYRGFGFEEPTGIVPDGSKKTKIQYPSLHNNMDKAYVIRTGDPIPEGVKESDKVEEFLIRTYKALGISSEVEIELELSPKIDGVSVNGTIVGDALSNPQTRGDESASVKIPGMDGLEVGEGITENEFGIQYEVFVTYEDAEKASAHLGLATPYVSCRHAASGLVNRLCSGENDELLQFLSLYPIEAEGLDSIPGEENTATYSERMDYLSNFAILPDDMIERKKIKGNLKKLLDKIEKTFEKYQEKREKLSYAIDGMVITVVDDDYQKTIGRDGRTNSYQIALKFDPASAEAEVAGIHLDTGKKGFRTIQVDLKHPIFLDGVKYDHVPVLSANLYEDLGLRVGSTVNVHRVGDVIPSITVIKMGDGKSLKLPTKCPDCGQEMDVRNKKLYCNNSACSGNLVGRIVGFFEGIKLEGYSDAFAELLIQKFPKLQSISDLFNLTEKEFAKVGMTNKDAREFQDSLRDAVANTPDYVILGSIGIPDMGPARAKMVLKTTMNGYAIDNGWIWFQKAIGNANLEGICIKAMGIAIGQKVYDYLTSYGTEARIKGDLKELSKHMRNFTLSFDNLLRVGHTGVSPSAWTERVCAANKFDIVDGKGFDILIVGSMESTSDKMKKAQKNNLPIYTEEGFLKQYDAAGKYREND